MKGEIISLEQLYKMLHISKRKAAWMLQNGIIPCEIRNTPTHKYSVRKEDVLAYMRCGYTGISVDMCDKIEEYANIWKISGKRWFDEHPWAMHPRGFGAPFTDEDSALLEELNNYRSILVSPLVKFFEIFEKNPTLLEVSAKLYNFLEEISLREKLEVRAAELRDKKRVSEADETVQIWNILIDCLDSLVRVAGEMPSDSSSYLKLLSASLEMSDIGKIPSGIDEVIIGEANSLKLSGVKHVYVIGLNEGVFPAPIHEDTILGDRDRRDLDHERTVHIVYDDIHSGESDDLVQLVFPFVNASIARHEGADFLLPFLNALRKVSSDVGDA